MIGKLHPLAFAADVDALSPVHVYAIIKGIGDAQSLGLDTSTDLATDEFDWETWKHFGARDRRHLDAAIRAGHVTSDGKRLTSAGEQLYGDHLSKLPECGRANEWRANGLLRDVGLPDGLDYWPNECGDCGYRFGLGYVTDDLTLPAHRCSRPRGRTASN